MCFVISIVTSCEMIFNRITFHQVIIKIDVIVEIPLVTLTFAQWRVKHKNRVYVIFRDKVSVPLSKVMLVKESPLGTVSAATIIIKISKQFILYS